MIKKLAGIACAACLAAGPGHALQLISNGGFETGNLSAWTVTTQAGSYAGTGFYASNSTTTSQSGTSTAGAKTGAYYAVSDSQGGPGTATLSQTFTVPGNALSVILSYDLFVNSYGGDVVDPAGNLDYSGAANQYALVSLLSANASLFSTTTGDLKNFYQGTDAGTNPNPYTSYSFNITSLVAAGQTYTLRFAEVNNLDILNMGVDNVSVLYTAASAVPETAPVIMTFLGIAGIFLLRSSRSNPA